MTQTPHPKIATPDHDVLPLIRERWSPRAFDPNAAISVDDLRRLFEAARWAPSSLNEQPWRFVVTDRQRTPEAFDAMLASLSPRNASWARFAPVLALVAVRHSLERNGAANAHAFYDTGQAVAFLTLQATSQGLGIRQMQGFSADKARAACGVPDAFDPAVVMAIGRVGDPSILADEGHRDAEMQPRARRALHAFVFEGHWDHRFPASDPA